MEVDWDRWHELLDIRDGPGLSPTEQVEYDRILEVVVPLDEEEARLARASLKRLKRKHEAALRSAT